MNTTEPILEIEINRMVSKNTYVFKLIVEKGNQTSSANHALKVDSPIAPSGA